MSKPYYLSAAEALSDALTPALTLGQGYPTSRKVKVGDAEKEFPVAYFWKDVIPAGEFEDNKTGRRLSVPGKRLDGWVEKFHAMRAAGIEIPAPKDHSAKADDNLGFVLDAKRNGDRLSLLYQVIGEDGALVALRNRASVCIDPDYVDETGKHWGDAIIHSAFTPTPVITGMGEFVPFAASRDRQAETPIYYLSAEQGDPPMDLKALREALGAAADVPDEKLPDLAAQRLTALRTESTTALSRATAAEAKVSELDAKVVTLSRTPAAPDPEALRDRADLTVGRIDLAVSRGDLPPFIATKLKEKVNAGGKPNAFMLSRADDLGDRPVDFVLALFDGAKLNPPAGSKSGTQLLSREIPGQSETDADAQFKAGQEQAAAYQKSLPPRA